jgi:hypothetical protein
MIPHFLDNRQQTAVRLPYGPAALYLQADPWHSFLFENLNPKATVRCLSGLHNRGMSPTERPPLVGKVGANIC